MSKELPCDGVFKRAIDKWGEDSQVMMCMEECAELIATLKHYRREEVDAKVVVDEIADVFLMIGQLIYMFGEEQVDDAVRAKLEKLNRLLEEGT